MDPAVWSCLGDRDAAIETAQHVGKPFPHHGGTVSSRTLSDRTFSDCLVPHISRTAVIWYFPQRNRRPTQTSVE
ncbi:unnamed protein product [Pleuronectes platessa]|uniref:Uncharacterized protein n=1 Tax=Pleuronectes platessa TaxID=8262 RepID=A0A9N7VP55_PLEPL|nr:unnamed protein product [Pleuronectes platessa]